MRKIGRGHMSTASSSVWKITSYQYPEPDHDAYHQAPLFHVCSLQRRTSSTPSDARALDFISWAGIFYWVSALKIFVSTPNLRNIVPFLHLRVAIGNYYTAYKFVFRKPKRWGPRWKTTFGIRSDCRETPKKKKHLWGPNVSVFQIQIYMAHGSSQCYLWVKKWNHISKIWRGYEDFKRRYPIKNPCPTYKIKCSCVTRCARRSAL